MLQALLLLLVMPPTPMVNGKVSPRFLGLEPLPGDQVDTTAEVVPFTGEKVTVTLGAKKHFLELGVRLPDIEVGPGWRHVTEADARQAPGPLVLVGCSETNELDGDAVVLGHQGFKVKGPKIFTVFAVEPFIKRFPGIRLRRLKDSGAVVLPAQTAELLVIPDDFRFLRVVGLDPTAKYEVAVAGRPGLEQVLVVSERELPAEEDDRPADAQWTASRVVLKGGGKAALPSTRQLALTLLGVRGLITEPKLTWQRTAEVTVRLVKAGKGDPAPKRVYESGGGGANTIIVLARQLLQDRQTETARALLSQCVATHPTNAECHYLYARTWGQFGDFNTAVKEACLALRYGDGERIGELARELLGQNVSKCR